MDELLTLRAVEAWCPDCAAATVMLPVDELGLELCCTTCDGAVWAVWAVETVRTGVGTGVDSAVTGSGASRLLAG